MFKWMIIVTYHIENYELFLKQGFQETVESSVGIRTFFLSLLFRQTDDQRHYHLFNCADINYFFLVLAG